MQFNLAFILPAVALIATLIAYQANKSILWKSLAALTLLSFLGAASLSSVSEQTQAERQQQDKVTFDRHEQTPAPVQRESESYDSRMDARHDALKQDSEDLFQETYQGEPE